MKEKLKNEYEFIDIKSINKLLEEKDLFELIEHHDLIFDASDNFQTRYISNDVCHEHKKPLISGAAEGMLGIVAAFNFKEDSPCYECLFPRKYDLNENLKLFNGRYLIYDEFTGSPFLFKLLIKNDKGRYKIKTKMINAYFFPFDRNITNMKIEIFNGPDEEYAEIIGKNTRSEERRVGKECRSRWSPYH